MRKEKTKEADLKKWSCRENCPVRRHEERLGDAPEWRHAQGLEASLEEPACLVLVPLSLLQHTRLPPVSTFLK